MSTPSAVQALQNGTTALSPAVPEKENAEQTPRPPSPIASEEAVTLAKKICIGADKITTANYGQVKCADGKILVCHFPPGNRNAAHVLNVGAPAFFLPGGGLNKHGNYVLDCNQVNYDAQKDYQLPGSETPCLCSILNK